MSAPAAAKAAQGTSLTFMNISCVGKAGLGAFRVTEAQLGWQSTDPGAPKGTVAFPRQIIASAVWRRSCGRGRVLLHLQLREGAASCRFAGFQLDDITNLDAHLAKYFGIAMIEETTATEGWSWFDWELKKDRLRLLNGSKVGLDVPVSELSQVSTVSKSDLSMLFQMPQSGGAAHDEVLQEMRLFLPSAVGGAEGAERLRDDLQALAGGASTGEVLQLVRDVFMALPRGKHDFEFFSQALKIRGKTQTYTLKYAGVSRLFLLQTEENCATTSIVLILNQPLRQGQQSHVALVLDFENERRTPVTLPQELRTAMGIRGSEEHSLQIMGRMLKHLTGKPMIASSSDFKDKLDGKQYCVRCTHKAKPGMLFPLNKSMIFIKNPVIWIRYDEIDDVELATSQMRRNSFDLVVHRKGHPDVEFSQFESGVYAPLVQFLEAAKVNVLNKPVTVATRRAPASRGGPLLPERPDLDDEEEDEDYEHQDDDAGSASSSADDEEEEEEDDDDDKPPAKKAKGKAT
mmetsp:Transcript_130432/g.260235  ORF Transcript_130432/g.260235 Transcript_130432/m.260235 type:complete len:516 (-) Transcript_130432:127-1674(-)|eukprot:CAMPEP_0172665680 /NCGR_PEP_ID=MMETSP1074-20121228/7396_1 /TAXON_ID=2916 /ORGANISM="Ceratium fusus, Strain PA161109" /LENGTH=515 /DNA_ID=CAMNT_0013482021 /DNA_START=63 /DNA_END=1610 /DNA_ORIENTATION=+